MPLSDKVSNIIGVELPKFVKDQISIRSLQGGRNSLDKNNPNIRDSQNLLYLANKTAWVRLVSSVDIQDEKDRMYFQKVLGVNSFPEKNPESFLAKQYILFGGTSKYFKTEAQFNEEGELGSFVGRNPYNYQLRSGIMTDGAYGMLGKDEVKKYGYRPMPGITNVTIESQGRLGSVRAATINFKCWSKSQLDIIDTLYFKLGFTMFLEWGNTTFYENSIGDGFNIVGAGQLSYGELYSIDPFENKLSKEALQLKIAQNNIDSSGNYDAMLGVVTNFNFSYNQEMGYDCTLKLISLGILADSIKINQTENLPSIVGDTLDVYKKTLEGGVVNRSYGFVSEATGTTDTNTSQNPLSYYVDYDQSKNIYVPKKGSGTKYVSWSFPSNAQFKYSDADFFITYDQKGKTFSDLYLTRVGNRLPIEENTVGTAVLNYNRIKEILRGNFESLTFNPGSDVVFYSSKYRSKTSKRESAYSLSITRNLRSAASNTEEYTVLENTYISTDKKVESTLDSVLASNADVILVSPKMENNYPLFTFKVQVRITENKKVRLKDRKGTETYKNIDFPFTYTITTDDSSLITLIREDKNVGIDVFQGAITEIPNPQNKNQSATSDVTESPMNSMSSLELSMRAIQLESLSYAIAERRKTASEVGAVDAVSSDYANVVQVTPVPLASLTFSEDLKFIKLLFSNGSLDYCIENLIDKNVFKTGESSTFTSPFDKDELYKLKINAYYGFATNLMAGKSITAGNPPLEYLSPFQPVDFKELLTSYVVPFEYNSEIELGTKINHPVYVTLGALFLIINNSCALYDKTTEATKPMVYLDFNPNHNFCLTNPQQISFDPLKFLIPIEWDLEEYKKLFPSDIVKWNRQDFTNDVSFQGYYLTDSELNKDANNENIKLYDTISGFGGTSDKDNISRYIPKFKDSGTSYRGKIMNVLVNIDYVMDVLKQFSSKDSENKVFLRQFIEQILIDMNKCMGGINAFRLSYSDDGNTLQIVDDQIIQGSGKDNVIYRRNKTEDMPLVGLGGIAKSLEIKTEVSNRLGSMIAIGANSKEKDKNSSGIQGMNMGYPYSGYLDRYVSLRGSTTQDGTPNWKSIIQTSLKFNSAVKNIYESLKPSKDESNALINYYMERMNIVRGESPATKAAPLIPVSINFTTDGISGITMGHAFTVSEELLPYTYNKERVAPYTEGVLNKVGFVVTGLTQTIDSNVWTTSVKGNMIFLKDRKDYLIEVKKPIENKDKEKVVNNTPPKKQEVPLSQNADPRCVRLINRKFEPEKKKALKETTFLPKLKDIASKLGANYVDMLKVMYAESALDPQNYNCGFNKEKPRDQLFAVGIIQFTRNTAKGLKTSVDELINLTATDQLDYVYNYYSPAPKGSLKDIYGIYGYTFFPAMLSHIDDNSWVIQSKGLSAREVSLNNGGIPISAGKKPGDPITVGDFKIYVNKINFRNPLA